MKKIILSILFLLSGYMLFAQVSSERYATAPSTFGYTYKRISNDSTYHAPYGDTPGLRGGLTRPGAMFFRTTDSSGYDWTGNIWRRRLYIEDTSWLSTIFGGNQGFNDVLAQNPDVYQSHTSDFNYFAWTLQRISDFTIHSDDGDTTRFKLSDSQSNLFSPNGVTGLYLTNDNIGLQTIQTPGDRYSLLSMDSTRSEIQVSFDTSFASIQTALVDEGGGAYTDPFVDLVAGSTVINSHLHVHSDRIEFHAYDGNFDIEGLKHTTSSAITLMTWDSLTNRTAHIPLSAVGGSQSLQQVSEIGNTSTLNLISYDSLKGQDGLFNASIFIGQYDVLRTDTLTALGTSITAHSGVTQAQGYVSLMATRMGLKVRNLGQGGASIDYLISNLNLIPNKDATHRFLTLEFNMNDADDPDTSAWKVKMQRAIDTAFARGWNGDDDMELIAGPYTEEVSVPYITDYVTATKTIGAVNNIPVADAYTAMANAGGAALTQDGVHPTADGHYYVYQSTTQAIPWDEYPGKLYVTGDAHISRTIFAGSVPAANLYAYNSKLVVNGKMNVTDRINVGDSVVESNSKVTIVTSSGQPGITIKQAAVSTLTQMRAGQTFWFNSSGQAYSTTATVGSIGSGNYSFQGQSSRPILDFIYAGGIVANEGANDIDIRFEGTTDANNFFSDAGLNRIGIGTNAPLNKLDINGDLRVRSVTLGTSVDSVVIIEDGIFKHIAANSFAASTPGIDDVLAEAQDLTANRTINPNGNTFNISSGGNGISVFDALNTVGIYATDISLTGNLQALSYGSGSITGTPAYYLAIDASGNVIESAATGGDGIYGGSGSLIENTTISGGDTYSLNATGVTSSVITTSDNAAGYRGQRSIFQNIVQMNIIKNSGDGPVSQIGFYAKDSVKTSGSYGITSNTSLHAYMQTYLDGTKAQYVMIDSNHLKFSADTVSYDPASVPWTDIANPAIRMEVIDTITGIKYRTEIPTGGSGSNFANADLTFTGDRAHDAATYGVSITGGDAFTFSAANNTTATNIATLTLTPPDDATEGARFGYESAVGESYLAFNATAAIIGLADGDFNILGLDAWGSVDTTTYKPLVRNSSGDVVSGNWAYAGGGGSGDVTKVGTPVNNQIGVWTGDGTIEGDANFTWTGTELLVGTSTDNGAYTAQFGSDVFIGGNTLKFGTTANTAIVGITNGLYLHGNTQTAIGIGSGTYYIDVRSTGVYLGGSASPTSTVQMTGSWATMYTATATSITAGTHQSIEVTATGQTITLPTAVGITGRIYTIKLTASGSCTVATTSSQTIDGSTTYSLSAQYKYGSFQSNGANWNIIANN